VTSLDLSIAGKAHFFIGNNVDPLAVVFAADSFVGVVVAVLKVVAADDTMDVVGVN